MLQAVEHLARDDNADAQSIAARDLVPVDLVYTDRGLSSVWDSASRTLLINQGNSLVGTLLLDR